MRISDYIESNPKIMLGKPVVKGTRLTVELLLTKMSDGFSYEDILAIYPNLKMEDIRACIAYAAGVIQSEEMIKVA